LEPGEKEICDYERHERQGMNVTSPSQVQQAVSL
jgi:hypothetical protein